MTRSERTHRRHLGAWLVAAALLGPACPDTKPIEDADYFAVGNTCTSEAGTVDAASKTSSESESDTIDASEECQPVDGKALVNVDIDGQPVYVEAVVARDLEATRFSCVHAFGVAVDTACTVTGTQTIELWETGGIGLGTSFVAFEADVSTLGVPAGAPGDPDGLSATVTVDCGDGPQAVLVGGDEVLAPIEGTFDFCDTSVELTSEVETPGTHIRVLTLQHRPLSTQCKFDYECVETFGDALGICGPNRVCQAGSEGDPCVDALDCGETAPHCGPGAFQGTCFDGSTGDPCWDGADCASEVCTAFVCD
jgi:hypothetical protein